MRNGDGVGLAKRRRRDSIEYLSGFESVLAPLLSDSIQTFAGSFVFVPAAAGIEIEGFVVTLYLLKLKGQVVAAFAETVVTGRTIESSRVCGVSSEFFIPGKFVTRMGMASLTNVEEKIFRCLHFA